MWLVENYQTFCEIKKFYPIFCIYKTYLISAERYKNAGVHILIIIKKLAKFGQAWKLYKMVWVLRNIQQLWNKKPFERAN